MTRVKSEPLELIYVKAADRSIDIVTVCINAREMREGAVYALAESNRETEGTVCRLCAEE